uniref:Uncharacterized protein n=1 Tax=Eutreptiella gymnastica TaxID=73025 RepID=A0A7S4G183_9EUGL
MAMNADPFRPGSDVLYLRGTPRRCCGPLVLPPRVWLSDTSALAISSAPGMAQWSMARCPLPTRAPGRRASPPPGTPIEPAAVAARAQAHEVLGAEWTGVPCAPLRPLRPCR